MRETQDKDNAKAVIEEHINFFWKDNKLEKILKQIVEEEFQNKKLIKHLNSIFSAKGLNQKKVISIFTKSQSLEELTNMELIAFTTGCYEVLRKQSLNPKNNFSNELLGKSFLFKSEELIANQMVFEQMISIDEYTFLGRISYKQIYEYMQNSLLIFNKESEGQSKWSSIEEIGGYVRDIAIDRDSVNEIADLILTNNFHENQIIFNIRLVSDEIKPDYVFLPFYKNVGRLIINPNYNLQSNKFTAVDILDGYHRIKGVIEAMDRYKKLHNEDWLEGGLDLKIVVKNLSDARRIVTQAFKKSDIDDNNLNSFKSDNYAEFINAVINNSSILKCNVGENYYDYMVNNKLTYKTLLIDTIRECTNINVNSIKIQKLTSKIIANTIDNIIKYIMEMYYNDDFSRMRSESQLLSSNMFVAYLAVACEIKASEAAEIADRIYAIPHETLEELELTNKNCDIKIIYDMFKGIATEGIK